MAFMKIPMGRQLITVACLFLSLHIISVETDLATELIPSSIDLTKSTLMNESSVVTLLLSNPSTSSSSILATEISADIPSNNTAAISSEYKEIQHNDNALRENTTVVDSSTLVEEVEPNPSTNSSQSLPTFNISTPAAVVLSPTTLSDHVNSTNQTIQDTSTNESTGETTTSEQQDVMVLQENNIAESFDLITNDGDSPKETDVSMINQTNHSVEAEHETVTNQTAVFDSFTTMPTQMNTVNVSTTTLKPNETWLDEPSSSVSIGVINPNESTVVELNNSATTHSISDPHSTTEITTNETATNETTAESKPDSVITVTVPTVSSTIEPTVSSKSDDEENTTLLLQTEILISNTAIADSTPHSTVSSNLYQSWFVFHFNCNCTPDQSFYTKFQKELRDKLALKTGIPGSELFLKSLNCSHNFRINITINSEYEDNMTGYLKEIQGSKDPFLLINGQKLFLEYATGGPGEYHPHPQVILSERHTDIEFVIYVALGSACAFLLTLAVVLVLCKYCQGKPYKGFDLNDTSHLSLRMEDYTLTQIPRAKSIYIDYCRPVGSEHYSPLDEQSVNSSGLVRSFDTSIVPLEDAPTELPETNNEKKSTSNSKEMYLFANEAKPSPHHEYEEIDVTSVKSTENLNVQSGEKKAQWGVDNATFTT